MNVLPVYRYMAPEVALGRQYNNSVDTYSFAVIIWQGDQYCLSFILQKGIHTHIR